MPAVPGPSRGSRRTPWTGHPASDSLLTGGRARPLDQLTAGHLGARLQARHARWLATVNPHLLINRSTAGGVKPVDRGYVQATVRRAGVTAVGLRAGRFLGEAVASRRQVLG